MNPYLAAALATFAAIITASPAVAEGLNLTIDGVRNANGSVLVLVFDDATAFEQLDWANAVLVAALPARAGRVSRRFAELTGDPYAVVVLHDENDDQDLNYEGQNLLEGIGATGATTSAPYPSFSQAAVRPGKVTVRVHYDQ
ncbi:MAG: DUF2141 domain-containing protein [Alphaproteobacteria bacterium]|nr:DUF2141 domain-containing protein [Alphaproteobacteria bacterium]